MALGNDLLLVTPIAVARRLCELIVTADFRATLGFTFSRISLGFLLALALAGILAALSAAVPFIETLLRPYVAAIQSVPVASFIVIAFLWLSARRLSTFIAFLMVFPVLYTNLLQGIRAADRNLLEMADVFRLSPGRRVRCIFLPALAPRPVRGLPRRARSLLESGRRGGGHRRCGAKRRRQALRRQSVSGDRRSFRVDGRDRRGERSF